MNGELAELILCAADESLTARQRTILDLRFGLSSGEPHTLAQVSQHIGVSRERIRQITVQSTQRLRSKGRPHQRARHGERPCAAVRIYLNNLVRPGEAEDTSRLLNLVEDDPLQVRQLVAQLLGLDDPSTQHYLGSIEKLRKERLYEGRRQPRKDKRLAAFADLLREAVYWPAKVSPVGTAVPDQRHREVSPHGEGESGSFFSEKLGRHVQYESLLERSFLQVLETITTVTHYQEQPFEVPYNSGAVPHVYYPDIFFLLDDGRGVVTEIKRKDHFALAVNRKKWAALKQFCLERGYGLLITDGRHHLRQWLREKAPATFSDALLAALDEGPLDWPTYKRLKEQYAATYDDFQRVVLRHRLTWQLGPFLVGRDSSSGIA